MFGWLSRLTGRADSVEPRFVPPENLIPFPMQTEFGVLRHRLLERIARSRFADNYILRGSSVIKHWLPEIAREPQDLDFVSTYPHDPDRCTNEIFEACNSSDPGPTMFQLTEQNILPMWEYDLFPGIRFHVPVALDNRHPTVQLDVAFDNVPALPTEVIELSLSGESPVRARAWTREACLASKLCWLANDCKTGTPDTNDVGDAILLARHGDIRPAILCECIASILATQGNDLSVFDAWDPHVVREFDQFSKIDRPYPDASAANPLAHSAVRASYGWLIDLIHDVIPLVAGLIWFPPLEEWTFLVAMAADPTDPTPGSAYADWLLERSDLRGELLAIHVRATFGNLTFPDAVRRQELIPCVPAKWCRWVKILR